MSEKRGIDPSANQSSNGEGSEGPPRPAAAELTSNQRALTAIKELMQQMDPPNGQTYQQERQRTFEGGEEIRIGINHLETSNVGPNEGCFIRAFGKGGKLQAYFVFESLNNGVLTAGRLNLASVSVGGKVTSEVNVDLLRLPLTDLTNEPVANLITTEDLVGWLRSNVASPTYIPFPPITFQLYQGF